MEEREFMALALHEAKAALSQGEVPVGAIIVKDGTIIAKGCNTREQDNDISGHAEIVALKKAAKALGHWNLEGCQMYVTLEPCLMCAGAILQSRLSYLCFAAKDEKEGAIVSRYHVYDGVKHAPLIAFGCEEEAASELLKSFFASRR